MRRFSTDNCLAQHQEHVIEFLNDYFSGGRFVLFISTLGVQPQSLYFPGELFSQFPNVDFRCIVEKRRAISPTLESVGELHEAFLRQKCPPDALQFVDVDIVASDGATVGGRKAVSVASNWYREKQYSDIVIDATGMSRGVCFPLVQQAVEMGLIQGATVHLLVASSDERPLVLTSESSDRAEWMHGFQGRMGLDTTADSLNLWVPQLSEDAGAQMEMMYRSLSSSTVAEVCPIVPFPATNARRGDDLLFEFERDFHGEWDCSHLNVIYAHESNPLDVFYSITKMVSARKEVFSATKQKAVTVLSPCGWRIGSLGMLLAAIALDLPMLYVETTGYNTSSTLPTSINVRKPDQLWHILLTGAPYENQQL